MSLQDQNSPMKLPSQTEVILQLIREELKSRKFFNSLTQLGLDNCYYQPNLDNLIMAYVGLQDDDNQTFDFYYSVIERRSELINKNKESVIEQALEVYVELVAEVKRRVVLKEEM
jgi:hypothetical protein